jgi:phage tail sheath protein FI
MPEYLAPGVFVEEVSFRAKSIEGVSTTTTGFVGATRYGPLDIEPEVITSLVEFERVYGGKTRLDFGDGVGITDNYMWNAARGFFEEGGKRLYVARAFTPGSGSDGRAQADYGLGASPPSRLELDVRARYPGAAGNGRVTFTFALGPNRLGANADGSAALRGAIDRDVVHVSGPNEGYRLLQRDDLNKTWNLVPPAGSGPTEELQAGYAGRSGIEIRTLTVTVTFESQTGDLPTFVAVDLPLDPKHESGGTPDSLFAYFAPTPSSLSRARTIPITLTPGDDSDGLKVMDDFRTLHDLPTGLPPSPPSELFTPALLDRNASPAQRSVVVRLTNGNDGLEPILEAYEGATDANTNRSTGLVAFEALEDISIVAGPGATRRDTPVARSVIASLIGHAERMHYRIAVIDSVKSQSIAEARALRALYDSSHAAFYFPWVRILDPVTGVENHYPPSGFVTGIYARNDIERAVWKAPANEVVTLALGFETMLNKSHQEVLNPEGVNCFRFFEGRGNRLWGARTMSSDPEWKYVNLRRYFAYLERSIDKGTQWAVFEPNGERLWANVRSTISDFLLSEWQNGALLGEKPERSFFVKCDRSTMSQNDLDNGRLVCLIGVAPLRPAEFVIFRIGQWTADRKI